MSDSRFVLTLSCINRPGIVAAVAERRVLARAVRYHLEDRVILNGGKTVVFST